MSEKVQLHLDVYFIKLSKKVNSFVKRRERRTLANLGFNIEIPISRENM